MRRSQRLKVAAALGLGLILRICHLLFGVPLDQNLYSDMKTYAGVADAIGSGIWLPRHFFQPVGLPLVILFLKEHVSDWASGLAVLQCCLSFLTLIFVWRAAQESFGFKTGLIALAIASVHVPWIFFTGYALTETIFTFLLSVCAWTAGRIVRSEHSPNAAALLWGICFALAMWFKGTHVFWGPLFVIGLFLLKKKQALAAIAALSIPVAAGLALHGVLTHVKTGKVQLGPSAGGLNFVEGKCFHKSNTDSDGITWLSPLYFQLGLRDHKQWDRPFTDSTYYWQQGLECVKESPFVVIQSLENIPYLFFGNTAWPLSDSRRANKIRLYELFFSVFVLCGVVMYVRAGYRRFDPREFLIWGLPVLAVCLCVYVFKSEVRFRLPFDVWFIPIAVAGWRTIANHPASARPNP